MLSPISVNLEYARTMQEFLYYLSNHFHPEIDLKVKYAESPKISSSTQRGDLNSKSSRYSRIIAKGILIIDKINGNFGQIPLITSFFIYFLFFYLIFDIGTSTLPLS